MIPIIKTEYVSISELVEMMKTIKFEKIIDWNYFLFI